MDTLNSKGDQEQIGPVVVVFWDMELTQMFKMFTKYGMGTVIGSKKIAKV